MKQAAAMKQAITLACLLSFASVASTQTLNNVQDLTSAKVQFGGYVELFAEKYSMSGRDARRPSETARLLLRPHLRFGNGFEVAANILLSTENQSFDASGRQPINRFGISPSWSWGSVSLGDFTTAFTPLTYQGIPVRGAAVNIEPGWFRFSALGGQTQRAVAGDATNGSYGRHLYAVRLGVGKNDASYFDLIALYADDDINSLEGEQSFVEQDTTDVGTLIESSSVTPQENLVLGVASQISLWQRKLVWQGELSGASYTRDKRASPLDDESLADVPSWLTDFFTPRVGTNVDYAYHTNLRFRLPSWDVQGGYKYVGPGYRSLGVGSLLVDRQVLRGRAAYHNRKFNITIVGSKQNDNVLGQKIDTTHRKAISGTLGLHPRSNILVTFRGAMNTMERDTQNPDFRIDYLNQTWGVGTRISYRDRWLRSVGIDYRLRQSDDANPVRSMSNSASHQIVMPIGFQLRPGLLLTPHIGIVRVKHPMEGWRYTHTEKLALRHSSPGRRWTNTLMVGSSFDDGSRRLVASVNSIYRVSQKSSLKFLLRNNLFNSRGGTLENWEELVVRLSLESNW